MCRGARRSEAALLREVELEPACLADAARIAEMSRSLIERGLEWRWRAGAIVALIRDPESEVLVARREGRLVGFAAMKFRFARRDAHLMLLAVDPACRHRGLGRELHEWLRVLARRGGVETVELEVRADNLGAHAFYTRLGYKEVGRLRGYYGRRIDAVRMDLRPPAAS